MKTIEEKAKAYDEALERAEHVKLTNTKEIVAAAEYIFPELSESEDERIRKWIVAEIKHQYLVDGKKIYCEEAKDALAYLKKLKEQKPIVKIPKFRAGDTIHLKSSNAEYTIEAISSSGYHGKGWSLTFDAEPDYELVSEDKEKQKEQNSDDVKKDDRDSDEERWTPTPTALHALYDASIGAKLTREDRNELYAIYLYLTDNRKDK